jgi:aryl-alcohol dehydrogenase (NADP+)
MNYRTLGRSGLSVSSLCLGAMMFGDRTSETDSVEIIAAARDAGINFIDTADVYKQGESERITGRAIAAERNRWIVATKVGNAMGDDRNSRGLSPRWLHTAIDDSLRRMGMDHIDIWYLHREDHTTPLAETIGAIADIVRAGKVRYLGISNHRGSVRTQACPRRQPVSLITTPSTACLKWRCCPPVRTTGSAWRRTRPWRVAYSLANTSQVKRRRLTLAQRARTGA